MKYMFVFFLSVAGFTMDDVSWCFIANRKEFKCNSTSRRRPYNRRYTFAMKVFRKNVKDRY